MILQPIGVNGELLIGGIQLARGYWNKHELTSEKFIDNPFDNEFNKKLYRTGDLARFLPNGNIEYIGRIDFQVKIHGYRIELGEIEVLLRNHPSVSDSVVIVTDGLGNDKTLIGYVVVTDTSRSPFIIDELLKSLSYSLPKYMVPSNIMALDKFPLTANGKLNRNALPIPKKAKVEVSENKGQKSETESMLLKIWIGVLRTDAININDNFFNIGGNSILVIQVASEIQKQLNINIEVIKLFEYPTIRTLANFLSNDSEQETIQPSYDRGAKMRNNFHQRHNRD